MTIYQTRQLGIEFERRVQTILPATQVDAKLDTETIYSFLNQFQQQYVLGLFNALQEKDLTNAGKSRLESILAPLLRVELLSNGKYILPSDFACYNYSISTLSSTYKEIFSEGQEPTVENEFVTNSEFAKISSMAFDSLRILRKPVVTITEIDGNTPIDRMTRRYVLKVLSDQYTNIKSIDVYYYRKPLYFDIMTAIPCELPMICFDDLVSGAVDLYMQYVRGGIRQQEEDGRRERAQRRAEDREAERDRKRNKEEQQ